MTMRGQKYDYRRIGGRPPRAGGRRVELESKIVLLEGRRLERRERLGRQPGATRHERDVTQP